MKVFHHLIVTIFAAATLVAQQPAPASATPAFHTLKELLDLIPEGVSLRQTRQSNAASLQPANVPLKSGTVGRYATLNVRVDGIGKTLPTSYEQGFIVHASDTRLTHNGSSVTVHLYLYFQESTATSVAAMKKGTQLSVTGSIARAELTSANRDVFFNVDLIHCEVAK